jgi:hypothetical protein
MIAKGRKLALVIGNSSYTKAIELDSPQRDANAVSNALKILGYNVLLGINLDYASTAKIIEQFLVAIRGGSPEVCLFYYSGHGLQINRTNFIVPIDFDSDHQQTVAKLVSIQGIMEDITGADYVRIILLDACRTGTTTEEREEFKANFEDRLVSKAIDVRGVLKTIAVDGKILPRLAEMKAEDNTFIAYATAQGRVAKAGVSGSLSPFTGAFIKYISYSDLPLSNLMSLVRRDVAKHTHGEQDTWDQSSLIAPFYFDDRPYPLLIGNTLFLTSLMLSMVPFGLVLGEAPTAFEVLLSAAPPIVSLGILLAAMQSVYGRLRGQFFKKLDRTDSWREHVIQASRNGVAGGFLGSSFAVPGIAIPYYVSWKTVSLASPDLFDQVEPLGSVMLEITYAIIVIACSSGFLSLFFARVRLRRWKLELSSPPGAVNVLVGAVVGGVLSGVIFGPPLMLYFGRMSRPQLPPGYLLSCAISSAMVVFYIANARLTADLDLKPLSPYRLFRGSLAACAASACGVGAAVVIFGALYATSAIELFTTWTVNHDQNNTVLTAAGAIYGAQVGIVLGVVIGTGVLLTERWSGMRMFEAPAPP